MISRAPLEQLCRGELTKTKTLEQACMCVSFSRNDFYSSQNNFQPFLVIFILSSANAFNLNQSKILYFGYRSVNKTIYMSALEINTAEIKGRSLIGSLHYLSTPTSP